MSGTALFELLELGRDDQFLGWVNIGIAVDAAEPRGDADLTDIMRWVTSHPFDAAI